MPGKQKRPSKKTIERIQRGFEAALPQMNEVIHFRLHGLPEDVREELSNEARAIAWGNYRQLCLDGRSPEREKIINKIAEFAAKHAYRGGHLAGSERINDAMSRSARIERGVVVRSLSRHEDDPVHPKVLSALEDYREDSPVENAIADLDIGESWRDGLSEKHRGIADDLIAGKSQTELAAQHGITRTRIWQHREEMKKQYDQLQAGATER